MDRCECGPRGLLVWARFTPYEVSICPSTCTRPPRVHQRQDLLHYLLEATILYFACTRPLQVCRGREGMAYLGRREGWLTGDGKEGRVEGRADTW